ncbi:MAG: N-acetyltransferase [Prevotella sp.]|jgi:GNAT superfamily N-acetyltransferase|nr:N-acetyltransferase [Prevotella sp.]
MKVEIRKVTCRRDMDDFVRLPRMMYHGVPQYVPDLERDVADVFCRKSNPGLEFSDVQPFVAYRDDVPVGRIVGIVNRKANERWQQRVVRFGLIEFIDDLDVSRALLDAVAQWGQEQGMDTLQGPLGITDFDKEGMLVEDFHLTGTMNTIWNPDYYPRHMEALGFQKAVDWLQIRIGIPKETPLRYSRTAQYVREQIGLRVVKMGDAGIDSRRYARQALEMFNEAYAPIFGFSALSETQITAFLDRYLPLLDRQMAPIVLNQQGEVVGAAVTIGSLSRALQKADGRLWPTGWYHLLKALKWKHEDTVEMLLVGVRPDYQGMGVNALFFDDLIPIYNRYGFKWAETGPQLEENVRELSQWKALQPEYVKRRRCYRKLIINK